MKFKIAGLAIVVGIFSSVFFACDDFGDLFSSNDVYQVKTLINGNSLECSILRPTDKISPYFSVSVENDPDVTGLLVYVLNADKEVVGNRVRYELQSVTGSVSRAENNDMVIAVETLDHDMPWFSLPVDAEMGSYTMVFKVLGKKQTLSQITKEIFYLGNVQFNPNSITVNFPEAQESKLILPGATVKLDSMLNYDNKLEPYVIWYDGKKIITEGKINEGAGSILWEAPDKNGFYSIRLEMFPYRLKPNMPGIYREITIPVSAKADNPGFFNVENPDIPAVFAPDKSSVMNTGTASGKAGIVTEENSGKAEIIWVDVQIEHRPETNNPPLPRDADSEQ